MLEIIENRGGLVRFEEKRSRPTLAVSGRIFDPAADRAAAEARLWAVARQPELLNDLEAELALVYHDPAEGGWRLLRDAFGQTPLFYAPCPGGFAWGFDLPALFEALGRTPPPDEDTLFDYLATHYRHIFREPGRTFHQGVRQVPAGCAVTLRSGRTELTEWLSLAPPPEAGRLSADEAGRLFLDTLRANTHRRLAAWPKAAFTISSGLDSSTVAALASERLESQTVFSVGYQGAETGGYDETAGIELITRARPWTWRHLRLGRPDLAAEVEALQAATRAPLITVTWLAYYHLARQARAEGFEHLFTGLGGDECLAGEFEHFFYFFADLKAAGEEARLAAEAAGWQRLHDHPVFRKNREVMEAFFRDQIDFAAGGMKPNLARYQANWEYFDPDWLAARQSPPPMPRPFASYLANRLYQEIKFETTPPTLWAEAASSRAAGLRASYPFLSPRLVRLALALPGRYKYDAGLTKALLRRALPGILPEAARLNPVKTGFNAPLHQWLRADGGPVFETIKSSPLYTGGRLRPGALERLFAEHQSGRRNHMMLLWSLLNAAVFLRSRRD